MNDMDKNEVTALLDLFDTHAIEIYIDGGWAVDALLGKQTRVHNDLDIATPHVYVPQIRELLIDRRYKDFFRDDTRDCNFVMADNYGHQIDIHSYEGNIIFGVPYPFQSLTGKGCINGYKVKCISAEWLVKFHTGYPLDHNDYKDVLALCNHFSIDLPIEYNAFLDSSE